MKHATLRIRIRGIAFGAALAAAGTGLTASTAHAQEVPPNPEEMTEKVIEIERLMRKAEEALASSLDTKDPAKAAKEMEKVFDEKAREQTGKSGEELRKSAASGSAEAAETIRKIMEESKSATAGASESMKKLLEETKAGGRGASSGIEWILKQARTGKGGSGSGSGRSSDAGGDKKPKDKPDEKKPDGDKDKKDEKDKKDNDKKDEGAKPPPSNVKPPREPEFEAWYATLPPQVKQAYDAQDWDSIPPQFRSIVREWTKRMAEEMDKERK